MLDVVLPVTHGFVQIPLGARDIGAEEEEGNRCGQKRETVLHLSQGRGKIC